MKKLVNLRRKKVDSIRVNANKYKRLDKNWRKPKGKDARDKINYKANPPKVGRRIPKKYRYLHPSGLKEIVVSNISQIKKGYAIRIAHTVGKKKRKEIVEKAKELGIKVLNPGEKVESK